MVKILCSESLGTSILIMLAYINLIVLLMYRIGFWDISMLKDTVVWTVTVGFVMLAQSATKATKEDRYFKEIFLENIKLTVIVEFIVNLYVFDLWVEFLLVPIAVLLGGMIAVAEGKPEYVRVLKFLNNAIVIFGLFSFVYEVYHLILGFKNFATIQNLDSFLLPILLTFAYMPFTYLMAIYSTLEEFFIRVNIAYRHNKRMKIFAKRQVILTVKLSMYKARTLAKKLKIYDMNTKAELMIGIRKALG